MYRKRKREREGMVSTVSFVWWAREGGREGWSPNHCMERRVERHRDEEGEGDTRWGGRYSQAEGKRSGGGGGRRRRRMERGGGSWLGGGGSSRRGGRGRGRIEMGEGGERLRQRDGHVGEIFYWISFSFSSPSAPTDPRTYIMCTSCIFTA